jgi:hypothetical protein
MIHMTFSYSEARDARHKERLGIWAAEHVLTGRQRGEPLNQTTAERSFAMLAARSVDEKSVDASWALACMVAQQTTKE